jgi:hypothetical protein
VPYIPKQYDSAKRFLGNYNNVGNVPNPEDSMRCSAYALYDDFYYNRPETFKVTRRGESDTEIYVPSTRTIVDSTARYLAVDFNYVLKGGDVSAMETYFKNLFKREELNKRFIKGKRAYLGRGDQVWYITADKNKPKGERITINTIHPSSVFAIEDPNNSMRRIGWHIVDLVHDPRRPMDAKAMVARRQTYFKSGDGIVSSAGLFELGCWDDRGMTPDQIKNQIKKVWNLWDPFTLPAPIKQLPVYHIPNNEPDGSTWGLSQVSGIEYLINGLNQSMTYEDLTLVLQGLGVYVTTAAPQIDKTTGKKGKYRLHPGNVVELSQGDTFERVSGVSTTAPFQEHMKLMKEWAYEGSGLPEMATGNVDVAVAQSGIALALKMSPILAENEDKQLGIKDKWDQMAYDLIRGWLPAYGEINSPATEFDTTFGDPMPIDREAYRQELIDLYTADMIMLEEVREKLEKIGYKNTPGLIQQLLEQSAKKADAMGGTATLNGETQDMDMLDAMVGDVNAT